MSLSTPSLTVRSSACATLVSAAAAAKANVAISRMTNLPDCGLKARISCNFYSKLQDRRAAIAPWSLVTTPLPLWGGVGVGVGRQRRTSTPAHNLSTPHRALPHKGREKINQLVTIGQLPSLSGRKASSAGMVARSL